jgi:catechol 2,3-dioxygenase-like lactoylglutathione lyase family enzyme
MLWSIKLKKGVTKMKEAAKGISIGIGVKNAQEALSWYKKLLGDVEVMEPVPGLFELKLTDTTWLQLDDTGYLEVGGGSAIIRFETDSIENAHDLTQNLTTNIEEITVVEGVVKYFDFKDPSGNRLSFVQVIQ